MKNIILSGAFALVVQHCFSQEWVNMINEPGKNFYEIQAAFNSYWKDKDVNVPGNGYKPFKRWENFMEPRVYPTGDLSLPSSTLKNFEEFLASNGQQKAAAPVQNNTPLSASTTWTAIGPMGPMSGVATNGFPRKAGRDNFITFHPTNPSIFWAGAPAGGLWKTTNGGSSWTTATDYLTVIGCSDLAVDPTNPNTMYLATGDGDAGDTYCIGVLKSTDGGATWNTTGLTFAVNLQRQMRRLIIDPSNPQILFAATNVGVYRTTNGGSSWTLVASGNFYDLEFKPSHPNTIYLSGTTFMRSTNGGTSFTTISSGIATTGSNRVALAVSNADTNYVYALRSSSSTNGFGGLYRSTDGGTNFTLMSNAPDVLANSCSGAAGGGQGWYDLAIAVSPLNKDQVAVGGVNVWSSNAGGSTGTWTCTGCWIGTSSPSVYLKADHHDLDYSSNGTLYAATDGGVFSYNVSNWIDLNNQRNIAQIYKIGLSGLSPNKWITGHQDNGSNIYNGVTYQASYAGDGMDCFIDRTNDNNLFASTPNGGLVRSTNGGGSYSSATSGLSGTTNWVTPWKQDPQVATRLYVGLSQVFVSNNLGATWTQTGTTGASGTIVEFAIAPSNNQVIYIIQGTSVRKTTNGGATWSATAGGLGGSPTFICIDPLDPQNAWVTVSGYSAGAKVYQTINGGTSWTNVSANLPNLPANCLVYEPGTNDRIYVGMDVGVYYKDNSSANWTLYNSGLPNVPISDLEISPAAPGKLRAATYGRGVYEVDVVPTSAAPVSAFTFSGNFCPNKTITLQDQSSNTPNSWQWSVLPAAGATLSSTNAQNPGLTVSSSGVYTVSLIAGNSFGLGSTSVQNITILTSPTLVFSNMSDTICGGESVQFSVSGAGSYTWQPGGLNGSVVSYTPATTQVYTCNALGVNGCEGSGVVTAIVAECLSIQNRKSDNSAFHVYPNPANDKLTLVSNEALDVTLLLSDVTGKVISEQQVNFKKEKNEYQLTISSLAKGVYFLKISKEGQEVQNIRFVKE
ncbi:MAG: T9SS type A sorting domain-containing protein [bacterium]|nr:T9SS type A sorting domain-containing protein [bacterium]